MKDTQNAWTVGSHVDSTNEFVGIDRSSKGNGGVFPGSEGEGRPRRVHGRMLLTVAVALFLSASLGCSGSFFSGPTLSSMYLAPASPTITPSGSTQLSAYGKYSDGNQSQISANQISWSSSDPAVATVTSPGGVVTGVSIGTTTVTASTTSAIPSSGCQIEFSGGGITKTCTGGSTETVTATVSVNVTNE